MTNGSFRISPPPARAPAQPPRIPYPRHSAYLAEALDTMRRPGAAGALDVRTPAALGTNLLAEALMAYGARKQAGARGATPDLIPPSPAPGDSLQMLQSARAAIAAGQPQDQVIQQLIDAGVDPSALWEPRA